MIRLLSKIVIVSVIFLIEYTNTYAQVGIGTATPADDAALEIVSTSKGLLPPRLSETERDAIANPAEGLVIFNTDTECLQWWNGRFWYDGCDDETKFCPFKLTKVEEVTTSTTGKTWMDRNLGANQAATSSDDSEAYGDLFQWGRAGDGHQCRDSEITDGPVASGIEDNDFIKSDGDWLSTSDVTRWNGDNKGNHDPCPDGFRIPTEAEWDAEIDQNNWEDASDVLEDLKLTLGGRRQSVCNIFGSCTEVSINSLNTGYYWSSTVDGNQSKYLIFDSENISMFSEDRANGFSVRCIKE